MCIVLVSDSMRAEWEWSSSAVTFPERVGSMRCSWAFTKRRIFVARRKNGFVPRIREELFLALKALQTSQCPFRKLPEIQVTQPPA